MSTPLANKTTFSSRMKMATLTSAKPNYNNTINNSSNNNNNNHTINHHHPATNGTISRLPPQTTIKSTNVDRISNDHKQSLAATTSRIAPPRSSLPKATTRTSNTSSTSNHGASGFVAPMAPITQRPSAAASSFANSRSSSKLSSISSVAPSRASNIASTKIGSTFDSRQSSLTSSTSVHAATVRKPQVVKSNYVPDTNSIRKGLAKFSNPIECQRQFQALNSEIRQLKDISDNKEKRISKLQEQLDESVKQGVGYATIVQYFAKKLKLNTDELDLESECEQLKTKVDELLKNEAEYESKLEEAVEDYKNRLQLEQDLKANIRREFDETKEAHASELSRIHDAHRNELDDLVNEHSKLKLELENNITYLKNELNTKTKDLIELRKEHDLLIENYSKLEDSLTKDKDARVKYAQEKVNQLQKEVDSLNSVLEMRTEKMHALEKDSILLSEAQQELANVKDLNKGLKQQLESLEAALEIKREKYEHLLVDNEKIAQELKRERKERRRMTMRSEQLENVLNESFSAEKNNITLHDRETVEN